MKTKIVSLRFVYNNVTYEPGCLNGVTFLTRPQLSQVGRNTTTRSLLNIKNTCGSHELLENKQIKVRLAVRKFDYEIGYGLFAEERIKRGTFLGIVTGDIIPFSMQEDNEYLFCFVFPSLGYEGLFIDARKSGNHTRFINHSYNNNVDVFQRQYDNWAELCFRASKDILKGEQILWNYGDGYWKARGIYPEELM